MSPTKLLTHKSCCFSTSAFISFSKFQILTGPSLLLPVFFAFACVLFLLRIFLLISGVIQVTNQRYRPTDFNTSWKDRNLHVGGVMLLSHKDIPHMPFSELEYISESVWVKVFENKTSHHLASWYRPPGGSSEDFHLFGDHLDQIRNKYKCNKFPSGFV